jgi:hypothetical protein
MGTLERQVADLSMPEASQIVVRKDWLIGLLDYWIAPEATGIAIYCDSVLLSHTRYCFAKTRPSEPLCVPNTYTRT